MASEIAVATKCIHCGKAFYGPRETMIVGEKRSNRLIEFLTKLNDHIRQEHEQEFVRAAVLGSELQGYLIMRQFETADKAVEASRDQYRWKIHQATLAAMVGEGGIARKTEETVEGILETMTKRFDENLTAEDLVILKDILTEPIRGVLLELREILQEPGKYAPPQQQPAAQPQESVVS